MDTTSGNQAVTVSGLIKRCWTALQEQRKRARFRAALYALPDRDLRDIGVSRSDIEYLARNGTDGWVDRRRRSSAAEYANGISNLSTFR